MSDASDSKRAAISERNNDVEEDNDSQQQLSNSTLQPSYPLMSHKPARTQSRGNLSDLQTVFLVMLAFHDLSVMCKKG